MAPRPIGCRSCSPKRSAARPRLRLKPPVRTTRRSSPLCLRQGSDRRIDRRADAVGDFVDLDVIDDEGRRQQYVVAALPIDTAARWIADETLLHALLQHTMMEPMPRVEGGLGGAIADQFNADQQAAAANVADMMMVAGPLLERRPQPPSLSLYVLQQGFLANDLLHRQGRRAGHRMTHVGVAVPQDSGPVGYGIIHASRYEHTADRLIARSE